MLRSYPLAPAASAGEPHDAWWIDLCDPTAEERATVERRYGFELPSRDDLSEVELSSRVSERRGVLFLSLPVARGSGHDDLSSPLGFVLAKDIIVTIRYARLRSFETAAATLSEEAEKGGRRTSLHVFTTLIGEMVDLAADLLESIASELDGVSRRVFTNMANASPHVARSNDALRELLLVVGRTGERLSAIRDTLLGLQRILTFVSETRLEWIPHAVQSHLRTPRNDVASLTEYENHLSDKVQFLLDAVLGLVSTKQNDIFQILTVVSVVGIPPTLIASIYGMNFRNMPELTWAWGYPYALGLIVLSTVLPLLWFKRRGWL